MEPSAPPPPPPPPPSPPPLLAAAWLGWLPVLGSPPWLPPPELDPGGPEQALVMAALASRARYERMWSIGLPPSGVDGLRSGLAACYPQRLLMGRSAEGRRRRY